jgi:DNA modification methylase
MRRTKWPAHCRTCSLYYARDGVELYCGDCLNFTPPQYDLLLTDPPYGGRIKFGDRRIRSKAWGKMHGDDDVPGVMARLAHALKSLRVHRHVYVFHSGLLPLDTLPLCGFAEIIWDKGILGIGDLSKPWGPAHEKIAFAVYNPSAAERANGDGRLSARLRRGSVLRSMRPVARHHPTEKPIDVLRQLIESSSMLGEVVFAPFAGSGSTLIAAALEGRRAIGSRSQKLTVRPPLNASNRSWQ